MKKNLVFIIIGVAFFAIGLSLSLFVDFNKLYSSSEEKADIMQAGKGQDVVSIYASNKNLTIDKMNPKVIYVKNAVIPNAPHNITWKSSDENIAIVHPLLFNPVKDPNEPELLGEAYHYALLIGVARGRVTLTATTEQGAKATFEVIVNVPNENATGLVKTPEVVEVNLDKTSASVLVGHTTKLNAAVRANPGYKETITWKSSNTGVATVDSNGNVKGVGAGTATITVTVKGQTQTKTATCKVTVNKGTIVPNKTPVTCKSGEKVSVTMSGTSKVKDYLPKDNSIAGILKNDDTHFTVVCKKKGNTEIHFASPEQGYLILPVTVK